MRLLASLLFAVPASAQFRAAIAPVDAPAFVVPAAPSIALAPSLSLAPLAAPSFAPALSPALAAPSLPTAPSAVPSAVPAARTVLGLRDDADRLYASLAAIHSRAKADAGDAALDGLKRALQGDFDGVVAPLDAVAAGADPRAEVKALRRERAAAERALNRAPANARVDASRRYAAASGALAAAQLRAARLLLSSASPVSAKAFRRNAALWALVGAHNSAAAAAAEASYLESIGTAESVFGDGRPYLVSSRWRNLRTELDDAARHARNGRPDESAKVLRDAAAALRSAGKDARDRSAADALDRLAASPDSDAILAAKPLIAHPELSVRTAIPYADMGAGLRALVHALESGRDDYLETAAREADARRAAAALSSPRPTAADREAALELIEAARAWAARGRVEGKRLAARNLTAAAEALARGDDALAARHALWAADALAERRDEIARIGLSVRRRLLSALSR